MTKIESKSALHTGSKSTSAEIGLSVAMPGCGMLASHCSATPQAQHCTGLIFTVRGKRAWLTGSGERFKASHLCNAHRGKQRV
jgi:hypothetical protein